MQNAACSVSGKNSLTIRLSTISPMIFKVTSSSGQTLVASRMSMSKSFSRVSGMT